MQADHHLLPATGADSLRERAGEISLPARPHDAHGAVRQSATTTPISAEPQTSVAPVQPAADFAALQPAARAFMTAHAPLQFLLDQTLILLAPAAGLLGIDLARVASLAETATEPRHPAQPASSAAQRLEAKRAVTE